MSENIWKYIGKSPSGQKWFEKDNQLALADDSLHEANSDDELLHLRRPAISILELSQKTGKIQML